MAQQLIDIGAVANDRTGDTWRAAFEKVNSNETELFDFKNANAFVFIAQESEFPTQDATTITLDAGKIFVISASFTTAKKFECEEGSVLTMFNTFGPTLTYSGTGTMFTGTDVNFIITNASISCPNATAFNFEDTVGNIRLFACTNVFILFSLKAAIFTNMGQSIFTNSVYNNTVNGINIIGTNLLGLRLEGLAMFGFNTTIKHIDLGIATLVNPEFNNLLLIGFPGSVGISGLTNSGNVVTGALGMITNNSFSGGMTDLSGLTPDDTRWVFQNNTPTRDSFPDALLSFRNNLTPTVILAANDAVIVNAIWVVNQFSQFTVTTGGRATYEAERDLPSPIDISAGLIADGGGANEVTLYIALNGSIITASGVHISISGSAAQTLSIPWQLTLSETNFIEIFVENNSGTTNIIVEHATIRIR